MFHSNQFVADVFPAQKSALILHNMSDHFVIMSVQQHKKVGSGEVELLVHRNS